MLLRQESRQVLGAVVDLLCAHGLGTSVVERLRSNMKVNVYDCTEASFRACVGCGSVRLTANVHATSPLLG